MVKLEVFRNELEPKEFRTYNIELLIKVVLKLDELSSNCLNCEELKESIDLIIDSIKVNKKVYSNEFKKVLVHLGNRHGIFPEGEKISMFTAMGLSLGVAFGLALSSSVDGVAMLPIGIGVGLVFGTSYGTYVEKKLKALGKLL
jgi:hypothetical protein